MNLIISMCFLRNLVIGMSSPIRFYSLIPASYRHFSWWGTYFIVRNMLSFELNCYVFSSLNWSIVNVLPYTWRKFDCKYILKLEGKSSFAWYATQGRRVTHFFMSIYRGCFFYHMWGFYFTTYLQLHRVQSELIF